MNTYNYVSDNGMVFSIGANFMWQSLCHNEDVMDDWNIYVETGGFGWSVCRYCGQQAHFIKRWPSNG